MEVGLYFFATLFAGCIRQCVNATHATLKTVGAWGFLTVQLLAIVLMGFGSSASLAVLVVVVATLVITSNKAGKVSQRLYATSLTLFLAIWFLYKYSTPLFHLASLQAFLSKYYLVGLSYLGFRILHYQFDLSRGLIKKTSTVDVLTWLFFFPSFLSGPIQRYQDWQAQEEHPKPFQWHLTEGTKRLIEGLFTKFVLADSIYQFSLVSLNNTELARISLPVFCIFCGVYLFYLYWDFSGYTSIAIGLGHFCGVKLPENFNNPLSSRNLIEFWLRWHISLSDWLREYVFFPVAHLVKRQKNLRQYTTVSIFLPPLMMFLTAGIWHGLTWGFIIMGLLHGVAIGALSWMNKVLPPKHPLVHWWRTSIIGHVSAMFITFLFLSFTFIFFLLNNSQLALIWQRWGFL